MLQKFLAHFPQADEAPLPDDLRILTQRVQTNPDCQLPEGYSKRTVKQTKADPKLDHGLIPFIGRDRFMVVSILNDIIADIFGSGFIDPVYKTVTQVKVVKTILKPKPADTTQQTEER